MARTAHDPRRQAARLGLLILATACAAAQEPPGGPPDFDPPVVLEVRPESAAVLPGFDDAVSFQFDEVINERSAQNLAELFIVSPRHQEIRVGWKRSRLEVKPRGGWRPNAVYRVVLLPGITDLRNNRLTTGAEVVFSTGPAIPDTRFDVTVVDWAEHRIATRGFLEAYPLPIEEDSTAYIAAADSSGDVVLTRVPPGSYLLFAIVDGNSNQRRDRREAFDSATVTIDSTAAAVFWAFERDTAGPQLREAQHVDSVTARIIFSQRLAPDMPVAGSVTARLLPDSIPVAVAEVWTVPVYDSLLAAAAALRDSLRQAEADSAAAGDSAAAPRAPPQPPAREPPGRRPGAREQADPVRDSLAAIDSARAAAILAERPRLHDRLFVRFAEPLVPGARYLIEARTVNPSGAAAESRNVLPVPEAAPPDSTGAPADTTRTVPDSTGGTRR